MTFIPIITEETYPSSKEKVWKAITDPAQMRQWYFDTIENFEATVGFETQFMVHTPNRGFLHIWKITEVVPFEKLCYDWSFEGIEGNSSVIFELSEEAGQTKLKLTATGIETYPKDIPEFKRQSGVEGWNYLIKDSLKKFLVSS